MRAAASGRGGWRRSFSLRRLRPYCAAFGAAALLALLLAAGSCSWFALPSYDGAEEVPGLDATVEIVRDAHAIPHIYAQSPRDGAFAMGYVHAQDRLWQLEMQRRIGQARLAEVVGEPAIGTDKFLRTLGIYRVAERNFERLSPEARAIYEAYAAGVNAYLEARSELLPLEFQLLGHEPEPWRPADSLVWLKIMAWDLGDNFKDELLRARLAGKLDRAQLQDLWAQHPDDPPVGPHGQAPAFDPAGIDFDALVAALPLQRASGLGSNAWALSGEHTDFRQAAARQRPAPAPRGAERLVPRPYLDAGLRGRGRDAAGDALPFAGPHPQPRLGLHQHRARRPGPLHRAHRPGRPRALPRAGGEPALRGPQRDHRGQRGRSHRAYGARDASRAGGLRRAGGERGVSGGRPCARVLVDRAGGRRRERPGAGAGCHGRGLAGLRGGAARLKRAAADHRLRRQPTAPSAIVAPGRVPIRASGPGAPARTGLDRQPRLGGPRALRRAAGGLQPGVRPHRHRQQPDGRPRLSLLSDRRLDSALPRAADRSPARRQAQARCGEFFCHPAGPGLARGRAPRARAPRAGGALKRHRGARRSPCSARGTAPWGGRAPRRSSTWRGSGS